MKNKFLIIAAITMMACTGKKDTQSASVADDVKFEQYMVEGQQLYTIHCSNCHQVNGEGLGRLYPPLSKSDYLLEDIDRAICIIKNGQEGSIMVNGVVFNQPMPAVTTLKKLEIAEIATYIYNSWGNEKGMVSIDKVDQALTDCSNQP